MGRPRSPHGYSISRYNRLTHGVEMHGILPSRGPEKCYHAERCVVAGSEEWRHLCVAGELCPYELEMHDAYMASACREFAHCRDWVFDNEFEDLLMELSYCELQLGRLVVLINREGLQRENRHRISGYLIGYKEGIGVGRYGDAIYGRFNRAYERLTRLEARSALAPRP